MSDALDYLLKARPRAMQAYFAFLKEAGGSLDPKTRALISVITKVATQTERGFRQYLRRALRAGATPGEILDALLMAFPALGLSRIVWAVDLILEMDLPEFRLEAQGSDGAWHDLAPADGIADGVVECLQIDGRDVFVCRSGDEYRVYDSLCPHQGTRIPKSALQKGVLTCPKHGWQFEAASGECIAKGDRPLHRFESKLEQGRLWAYW